MIDYDDALRRLLDVASPLTVERIPAREALGRVLAAPVVSAENLPPFDNSAMDGFALRTAGLPISAGTVFDVHGSRAAGDGAVLAGGGAWEIMTGARVPDGLDAVVPVEQVRVLTRDGDSPTRIEVTEAIAPAQHVRRSGEDVAIGQVLAPAGRRIDAALDMLCAAVGVARVDVRRRPRVALINTGRELVDEATQPLQPGEIRNSNGPFLASRLVAAGAEVVVCTTVGDDIDVFLAALGAVGPCDAVVSTGAVSMGRFDFVPEALARIGARTLFHKVRIRPGKPILAATLPSGALFFGLPGNPASTAVGLRFFVEPVLRRWLDMAPEPDLRLPLAAAYGKRVPLRMHLKARVRLDADARAVVDILGGQESFRIRPLLDANAWAVVDADVDALAAGACVRVASLGHLEPIAVVA